ncbi:MULTISPECIES: hypothetical protein [Hydrocarboniphaga]|uniref:hypothetical protein n=1 Tax=Hydrocarboniphaga TaxID=243627 RepID=UPI0012F82ADD|nr:MULTISPECIES: hypothetical protein [Hydrocarboniphaga]MDZ4077076.1 hypothetical protein [Hydrocarboniphaga sp.]
MKKDSVLSAFFYFMLVPLVSHADPVLENDFGSLAVAKEQAGCHEDERNKNIAIKIDSRFFHVSNDFVFRGLDNGFARFVKGDASVPNEFAILMIGLSESFDRTYRQDEKIIKIPDGEVRFYSQKPDGGKIIMYQMVIHTGKQALSVVSANKKLVDNTFFCSVIIGSE